MKNFLVGWLIGFKDLFGDINYPNRMDMLQGIDRLNLITELAALNYRLRGNKDLKIDTTLKTQISELKYFSGGNEKVFYDYAKAIDILKGKGVKTIFSRQACLFGLEEIIQSNLPKVDGFKMSDSVTNWIKILNYILLVNDEITKIKESADDDLINFETLNPKLLPLAELMIVDDPFLEVNRGLKLMQFFHKNVETSEFLFDYFNENYNVNYERYIYEILNMYMGNKHNDEKSNFFFRFSNPHLGVTFFDVFSKKYANLEFNKLLNIKKNPFFKSQQGEYLLTDINNLLGKAYYQFINDFYFDKLKGLVNPATKKEFTMQAYKGILGQFFEQYIEKILKGFFRDGHNRIFRSLSDLKIDKGQNEFSDFYFRDHNNIMLGEIKSTCLYDNEKYSGDITGLYKNNKNRFFRDFGVDQIVKSIEEFDKSIQFDKEIKSLKKIRIFPVIVFNEKALQTFFMAHVFSTRFRELLSNKEINKNIHIFPLTLIHVSDLERMESKLRKNPEFIWEIISKNFERSKIIPAFYQTLNQANIKSDYSNVRLEMKPIIEKYSKLRKSEK